jgi:hypothetical protein
MEVGRRAELEACGTVSVQRPQCHRCKHKPYAQYAIHNGKLTEAFVSLVPAPLYHDDSPPVRWFGLRELVDLGDRHEGGVVVVHGLEE